VVLIHLGIFSKTFELSESSLKTPKLRLFREGTIAAYGFSAPDSAPMVCRREDKGLRWLDRDHL